MEKYESFHGKIRKKYLQFFVKKKPLIWTIILFYRLRDAEEGVLPKDNKVDIKPGITYQDVNEAVQSLAKFQDIERQMKKKEMKKKKKSNKLIFILRDVSGERVDLHPILTLKAPITTAADDILI